MHIKINLTLVTNYLTTNGTLLYFTKIIFNILDLRKQVIDVFLDLKKYLIQWVVIF